MTKQKGYNSPLRSSILICSIRTEEAASDVLKYMLRIIKGDSKTLGSKSSSLSFKNKIDLLYDIDDLTKDYYTRCLKFMELRNQFIHNPKCNSFIDLEIEAPDVAKFLKNKLPNKHKDPEFSYAESFKQLWMQVLGKLLTLKLEYRKGMHDELMKFVNAKTIENFDVILKAAYEEWKKKKDTNTPKSKPHPLLAVSYNNSEQEVSNFEYHLKMSLFDEQIKILELVEQNQFTEKDVYKRKIDFHKEITEEIDKEKDLKEKEDKEFTNNQSIESEKKNN